MKYSEFVECLREKVELRVGENANVTINHVYKNNGKELDGIVILENGRNMAPTIYVNDYYQSYNDGRQIDDIVDTIWGIYDTHKDNLMNIDTQTFNSFDNIKDRVVYKLVNYEKNIDLLNQVPHKKILDLAVMYYYLLDTNDDIKATALIHNEHIKAWKIDDEKLHEAAVINTPELLKAVITPMSAIIDKMMTDGIDIADESGLTLGDVVKVISAKDCGVLNPMYILTNEEKYNGAACMLYDGVLKEFAEYMNCDMYILPSSIHEIIILLKNDEYNKENLRAMVREVNKDGVAPDEILSDNVYEYNRADGFIRM